MTGMLYRLAQLCVRRKFVVLAVWLVATIALVAVSHRLGDNTNDNLSLPGTDSQAATDALAKSFSDQANGSSPIVVHVLPGGGKLTDAKNAEAVDEAAAGVAKDAARRVRCQPAHAAGRDGAQQGQDDRLSVGHARHQPRRTLGGRSAEDHRRPPSPRRRPGSWSRPAGSSARRSRSRRPSRASWSGSSPRCVILTLHVRHRRLDAAADPHRDSARCSRRSRSSACSGT